MLVSWKNVKVTSLGLFDLTLPVGTLGTGNPPFVSVTALIHGDETAGLLALYKFIEKYASSLQFQGTIRLIPVANPLGAFTCTRASYLDGLDMNRVGIGDPNGQITERLANELHEQIKGSALVINFHEFEADSPLTCVYTNCGSDEVRRQIIKGMLAFAPDVIWSIPRPLATETKPMLSFDSMVAEKGTPIFSVEFARGDLVTPDMMDACLSKLRNVLIKFGVVRDDGTYHHPLSQPKVVGRTPIYALTMGVWKPQGNLMDSVKAGQIIGMLYVLPDFSEVEIQSPKDGFILQIRPMEVVKANSIVFAIGIPDEKLRAEINNLQ